MANKKGGRKEKTPDKEDKTSKPECCAVVVKMDGKGKTVLPLKMEDGDIKIGDKTLKIRCEGD